MYCMGYCLMLRHLGTKAKGRACLVDMERRCLEGPPMPVTETSLKGFSCPVEDNFPGDWMLPFRLHCVLSTDLSSDTIVLAVNWAIGSRSLGGPV